MSYPRDLNDIADDIHDNAVRHGFWDGLINDDLSISPNAGLAKLMLITTEVAEAAEVIRDANDHEWEKHLEEELSDIIIRVLDAAAAYRLNIDDGVRQKMAKNRDRPMMHGKLA